MPQEFSRLARLFIAFTGLTVLAACGGGGGSLGNDDGDPPPGGGNPPPGGGGPPVTVSGRITFERLPFSSTAESGLNPNAPIELPAREVVVQAMSGNSELAATTTDANGNYSLSVPGNTNMFIRARAQMAKTGSAPTWIFTVRDNTSSDAIYVLDGASFNSGSANVTRDLRAPSDWNGNGYSAGRRAAPFAILDTVYQTKQLILSAAPNAQFPELNLYWSEDNKNAEPFCPDSGNIGTSFYFRDPSGDTTDECDSTPDPLPEGIYILGDYDIGDTDEYDVHVIAHEFGHYFEDRFSRSDSIGGEHMGGDRLDFRVAFGEGWGNAFAAMTLNDPQYRDSFNGISEDFGFNLETNTNVNPGWFSEASVGEFLWDVFDTTAESGDAVELGFPPIFEVMTNEQVDTPALTSIFSFATALRANNGSESSEILNLLQREEAEGTGEFGTGASVDSGDVGFTAVYTDIQPNTIVTGICSTNGNKVGNKLGNRRFLRYQKSAAGLVNIRATGQTASGVSNSAPATDPDILVFRQGALVASGETTTLNQETISSVQLDAGTYVLEVYAFETIDPREDVAVVTTPRCMNLTIQEL